MVRPAGPPIDLARRGRKEEDGAADACSRIIQADLALRQNLSSSGTIPHSFSVLSAAEGKDGDKASRCVSGAPPRELAGTDDPGLGALLNFINGGRPTISSVSAGPTK